MRPTVVLAAMLGVALLSLSPASRAEEGPVDVPMLNLSVGNLGVLDTFAKPTVYGAEYRGRTFSEFKLVPAVGLAVVDNGAGYLYLGLRYDWWVDPHWSLTPNFSVVGFHDGGVLKLGDTLEFRSGLELAYRFDNQWRAGFAFYHISNGGLSKHNPGTEGLIFSLSIPLSGY